MRPRFTILLPLIRPPVYLPLALESVRAQSVQNFELFIVCDGAPQETVDYARAQGRLDSRIRTYSFPKGERFGEAHWHAALADARGRYVVHLEDDDLWFPNHLEELEALLSSVDFGHTLHTWLHADGSIETMLSDISNPEFRRRFLTEKFNRIGYSVCGYRLDAYRRLSEGWGPAPQDVWTDLHMWRRFFRAEGMKFGTRMSITAVVMADHLRQQRSMADRIKANQDVWRRVVDPSERAKIVQAAWTSVVGTGLAHEDASRAAQNDLVDTRKALQNMADAQASREHDLNAAQRELEETRQAFRAVIEARWFHEQAANAARAELIDARKALQNMADAQASREHELNAAQRELEETRPAFRAVIEARWFHEQAANAARAELIDARKAIQDEANARAAREHALNVAQRELKETQDALRAAIDADEAHERAANAAQAELVDARKAIQDEANARAAQEQALNAAQRELKETQDALRAAIGAGEAHERTANLAQAELVDARNALREANNAQLALRGELDGVYRSRSWRLVRAFAKPLARIRGRLARPSQ